MKNYIILMFLIVLTFSSCSEVSILENNTTDVYYNESSEADLAQRTDEPSDIIDNSQYNDDETSLVQICEQSLPDGWKRRKSEYCDNSLFSWIVPEKADNMSKSQLWFTNKTGSKIIDNLSCSFGDMKCFSIHHQSVLIVQVGQAGFKVWYLDSNGDPKCQEGGPLYGVEYDEKSGCIIAYSTGIYSSKAFFFDIKQTKNGPLFFEYGGYKDTSEQFLSYDNSQSVVDDLSSNGYNEIMDYIYRDIDIITLNVRSENGQSWSFNYAVKENNLVEIGHYASPYEWPFASSSQLAIFPKSHETIINEIAV